MIADVFLFKCRKKGKNLEVTNRKKYKEWKEKQIKGWSILISLTHQQKGALQGMPFLFCNSFLGLKAAVIQGLISSDESATEIEDSISIMSVSAESFPLDGISISGIGAGFNLWLWSIGFTETAETWKYEQHEANTFLMVQAKCKSRIHSCLDLEFKRWGLWSLPCMQWNRSD